MEDHMGRAEPVPEVTGPRPHVVAVVGSPRRRGNTATLVDAALGELERAGCRCTRILLGDLRIHPCHGHVDCGERTCPHDDDLPGVLEQVYGADGLILASPVYYENVTAQMKLFIDRNATRYFHDERLAPRAVGLVAVSAESGLDDTLAALRRFVALSVREEPPVLTLGGFADAPGEAAQDAELMAAARTLGRSMAGLLGLPPG
jgi:multimeric flavodoxin WrbA